MSKKASPVPAPVAIDPRAGDPGPHLAAGGAARTRVPPLQRGLAAATAALLAVDAWVHFSDARFYEAVATPFLSQAALFRAQAAVAVIIAIALLVRPHPVVWAAAALVAGSAAAAVLLYTFVDLGAVGPVPNMYEPTWALPGKPQSAVAELAATAFALVGFTLSLISRRRITEGHEHHAT